VDILIIFTNKIILSIFWLEIWWDVIKYPNTLCTLVGLVGTGWQKSSLNLKLLPNSVVLPRLVDPYQKKCQLFDIIA